MLSGSVMAILSMLVQQISEIRQKPTLLGPDPQNTSYCSTLDKIAIIEGNGQEPETSQTHLRCSLGTVCAYAEIQRGMVWLPGKQQ